MVKTVKIKLFPTPMSDMGFTIKYADETTKSLNQIGMSANTTEISVYILGIKDKTYLPQTYGKKIGKASVTGYCINF